MPRATSFQYSFNAGEWSPSTWGRIDLQKRRAALAKATNIIPLLQGAATRRPGTWYVAAAKTNGPVRLKRFEFNAQQSYILEFGVGYIRFFTNQGQLLSGTPAVPYEVATDYTAADLPGLAFTQSADVLYIAHKNYPPKKLERLGATNWQLVDVPFLDGPYLARNITDTYLKCSVSRAGASGTLTANKPDGINNGAGFTANDVGRLFRIGTQSTDTDGTSKVAWSWGKITGVTDSTHASVTMQGITPQ